MGDKQTVKAKCCGTCHHCQRQAAAKCSRGYTSLGLRWGRVRLQQVCPDAVDWQERLGEEA